MNFSYINRHPARTLLYYLEDPVAVLSARGRMVYANPSFWHRFKISGEDVSGQPASGFLPRWLWQPIQEHLGSMGTNGTARNFWAGREGESIRVTMRGIVLNEKVAGAVITFHDATREVRLKRRNLDLFRSLLTDLGYPLEEARSILSQPDTMSKNLFKGLSTQIDQAQESIIRLKEMGEIFLGEVKTERVPFYPARLIQMALKSLRPTAQQRRVFLEEGLSRELPRVLGDPALLSRVLALLVDYMIRLVPRQQMVVVSAELLLMTDGTPRLAYSISGTGMVKPEAELSDDDSAFESFATHTDEKKRSMLRAILARQLVTTMGGTVSLAAHELAGTTVCVQVPVQIHYQSADPDPAA